MTNRDPVDLLKLKQGVQSGALSWQEALAIVARPKKLWNTAEWRTKRKRILASSCAQCGTSTPPLVLQHTWQPRSLPKLFDQVRSKYYADWLLWKEKHPIVIDTSSVAPDADGCPKCHSPTIRYRKKANNWKCVAQEHGVACGNVFDKPIRVVSHATITGLSRIARQKRQEEFDSAFGVGKEVSILAIEQHRRYMSMQDTITLCKRCAFVADRTRMVLCNICRSNYHSRRYSCCSKCAGVEHGIQQRA